MNGSRWSMDTPVQLPFCPSEGVGESGLGHGFGGQPAWRRIRGPRDLSNWLATFGKRKRKLLGKGTEEEIRERKSRRRRRRRNEKE